MGGVGMVLSPWPGEIKTRRLLHQLGIYAHFQWLNVNKYCFEILDPLDQPCHPKPLTILSKVQILMPLSESAFPGTALAMQLLPEQPA